MGSLAKSSECGCQYCHLACEATARDFRIKEYNKDRLDAVIRDSGLQFPAGGGAISEFFVLKRKNNEQRSKDSLIA